MITGTQVQCGLCKAIQPTRAAAVACYDSHARRPVKEISHYCNDSANAEWLTAMREMYAEGERTPAQADLQIRADFPRHAFCLYRNGEAVGVSSQYKAIHFARQFLLAELAQAHQ